MSLGDPKSQKQLEPRSLVGSTVEQLLFWAGSFGWNARQIAMPASTPPPPPPQLGDGLMSHPL